MIQTLKQLAQSVPTPPDLKLPGAGTDASARAAQQASQIAQVRSIVFGIIGAVSILIITIAGVQYILSQGDPQRTAKAKNTILYTVIGLVVAILATSIVSFVLTELTK